MTKTHKYIPRAFSATLPDRHLKHRRRRLFRLIRNPFSFYAFLTLFAIANNL